MCINIPVLSGVEEVRGVVAEVRLNDVPRLWGTSGVHFPCHKTD